MSSLHIARDSGTHCGLHDGPAPCSGSRHSFNSLLSVAGSWCVVLNDGLIDAQLVCLTEAVLDYWACAEQPRDSSWVTAVGMMASAGDWHGAAVLERVPSDLIPARILCSSIAKMMLQHSIILASPDCYAANQYLQG